MTTSHAVIGLYCSLNFDQPINASHHDLQAHLQLAVPVKQYKATIPGMKILGAHGNSISSPRCNSYYGLVRGGSFRIDFWKVLCLLILLMTATSQGFLIFLVYPPIRHPETFLESTQPPGQSLITEKYNVSHCLFS